MKAWLNVQGSTTASTALWDWLLSERELRGLISRESAAISPGAMGDYDHFVVMLTSGTATAAVLARSIQAWWTHRHGDITLTVRGPNGKTVSIDARRVQPAEVEHLLLATLTVTPEEARSSESRQSSTPAPREPGEA